MKRNICYTFLNIFTFIICVNCNSTISEVNDNIVIAFEGVKDDTTTLKTTEDQSDLVGDFFEHIKEIFDPDATNTSYEVKVNEKNENDNDNQFTLTKAPSKEILLKFLETTTKRNKILAMFDNMTLGPSGPTQFYTFKVTNPHAVEKYALKKSTTRKLTSTYEKSTQTLNRRYFERKTKPSTTKPIDDDDLLDSETSLGPLSIPNDRDMDLMDQQARKLSCILCDNVKNRDCNSPENKLLPLTRCEHSADICYTMQTPFGIVDRGCYNPFINHTTYVCACNLCNSIPLHDLPYVFTDKKKWLYNVQEISHGSRLRNSLYKQMACIQCEVNQTANPVPDINCLEGKYRVLKSQYCNPDEICGIRSIKSEGYIWRGCIQYPRYNYLWSFCDNDLCNFDAPTSLYDII